MTSRSEWINELGRGQEVWSELRSLGGFGRGLWTWNAADEEFGEWQRDCDEAATRLFDPTTSQRSTRGCNRNLVLARDVGKAGGHHNHSA
jgi:hypothetical protein